MEIQQKNRRSFILLLLLALMTTLAACPPPGEQYILQADETPVLLEEPVIVDESGAGAIVVPAEEVDVEDLGGEPAVPISPLALEGTLIRAVSLFDRTLQLADGRNVGSIRDFVVDANTGQLLYAVVAYDELFGLGGTQVALPLASLGWNPELQLALTINEETLRAAPAVTNEWPAEYGEIWHVDQANFWGQVGLPLEVGPQVAPVRLRPMIGLHAGGLGPDLGILEDMLFDLSHERVVYLAIFQTTGLHDPDRVLLVPYGVAEFQLAVMGEAPAQAIVLLAVEPEVLDAAPWLDRGIFLTVDFMDASFVEELNSYWQEQGQPVPSEE